MANRHNTLTGLFDDIAAAIRGTSSITEDILADAFPAYIYAHARSDCPAKPSVLNDCPWSFIKWASDEGYADLFWNVGDRKAVTLTDWGSTNADYKISGGTYYCYILGFDHNSAKEGANRIHFEFGFSALSGGTHIAFCGGDYSMAWGASKTSPFFTRMNADNTNVGGWASSLMRTGTLNGTNRSFMTAIPSDLKSVLKTVTKYTDNKGGGTGDAAANVTATTDTIFLTNSFEVYGFSSYTNTNEANYTQQYQYYKNGNAAECAKMTDLSTLIFIHGRSPKKDNSTQFRGRGDKSEYWSSLNAKTSYGVAPCFCV